MTKVLPNAGDPLNNPSHSFLHRVVTVDDDTPEESVNVGAGGTVEIKGGTTETELLLLSTNVNTVGILFDSVGQGMFSIHSSDAVPHDFAIRAGSRTSPDIDDPNAYVMFYLNPATDGDGEIMLRALPGDDTSGGGSINITAGNAGANAVPTNNGGNIAIRAGDGIEAYNSRGGKVEVFSGLSPIQGASSMTLDFGDIVFQTGMRTVYGGGDFTINLSTGATDTRGGAFTLQAGFGDGTGNGGDIDILIGGVYGTGTPGVFKIYQAANDNEFAGILDFESITTADKTYTFPDVTGDIIVSDGVGGDINFTSGALGNRDINFNDEVRIGSGGADSLGIRTGDGGNTLALSVASLTTDRTITFPDQDGEFVIADGGVVIVKGTMALNDGEGVIFSTDTPGSTSNSYLGLYANTDRLQIAQASTSAGFFTEFDISLLTANRLVYVPNLDGTFVLNTINAASPQAVNILSGSQSTLNGNGADINLNTGIGGTGSGVPGKITLKASNQTGIGDGGEIIIRNGDISQNGGNVDITAGMGGATSGDGGKIEIRSGMGQGINTLGGDILIQTGDGGPTASSARAGHLNLRTGESYFNGPGYIQIQDGVVTLAGGTGKDLSGGGYGGRINIYAADGGLDRPGGGVSIYAGYGNGTGKGGDISFAPGSPNGTGTNGKYVFWQAINLNAFAGILDFDSITTANKTFTFPDLSGTFVLKVSGNVDLGDGTNYTRFSSDGTQTMAGTARVTKAINLGIDGLAVGVAAPVISRTVNFYGYAFSINDDGYVRPFELPYDWDTSTNMVIKIHWASNNTSASKKVKFQVDYSAVAHGTENINVTTTTLDTGDVAVSTTAYRLTEASVTITAANLAQDDLLAMQVKRIATAGGAGEEPDNEPIIVSIEVEYTANKLGENI